MEVMSILKKFFISSCFAMAIGCSTGDVINLIPANTETIDVPEIGIVVNGTLGSTLVAKGFKTTYRGVEVTDEGCVGSCTAFASCNHRIVLHNQRAPLNQQLPGARESGGDALCAALKMRHIASLNCGSGEHLWFVCKGDTGWFSPDVNLKSELDVSAGLKEVEIIAVDRPSFVQEFIYNGRYEDNVKFIYREFSDDWARPAFTQEVQYDLGTGNEFGFRNLLIEVVSATNTNISYRVIRSF